MGNVMRGQTDVCAVGAASVSAQVNQNAKRFAKKTTVPTRTGVANLRTADIQLSVRSVPRTSRHRASQKLGHQSEFFRSLLERARRQFQG